MKGKRHKRHQRARGRKLEASPLSLPRSAANGAGVRESDARADVERMQRDIGRMRDELTMVQASRAASWERMQQPLAEVLPRERSFATFLWT